MENITAKIKYNGFCDSNASPWEAYIEKLLDIFLWIPIRTSIEMNVKESIRVHLLMSSS